MAKTTQTRVIRIVADVKGDKEFKDLARRIANINKSTKSLSFGFRNLQGLFAAGIFGIGLREIANAIDSFQLLEDRIKVFTGSSESASEVFDKIAQAATFTRSSIDGLAQAYSRVALATTELGLSQDEIIATTALLQQTFRISGSTLAEAVSSTIQLTQGLSSGALRGQELRSVLESNGLFAGLLAKELGVARGQLIKFAEAGQISSTKVLRTLFNNFKSINEQAANLSVTIGQAVTIATDQLRLKLRSLNKTFNITEKVTNAIFFALDNLTGLIIGLSTAFALLASPFVISFFTTLAATVFSFTGIVIAVTSAVTFLATTWDTTGRRISIAINSIKIAITELQLGFGAFIKDSANNLFKFLGVSIKVKDSLGDGFLKKSIADLTEENKKLAQEIKAIDEAGKANPFEDFLTGVSENFIKTNQVVEVATGRFAQLNEEYGKGAENLLNYRNALDRLELENLNQKFAQGEVSLQQYTNTFIKLNSEVEKLSRSDQILLGVQTGLSDVINGIGNLSTNIRSGVSATFGQLEDQILNFVKTGKFAFRDFAQFVIDELTRIAIKLAIVRPLAQGIFGSASFSSGVSGNISTSNINPSASSGAIAAKGLAVGGGNVLPFAKGGVVSSPSFFPLSGGRTGLMGEAGAEAIMPLERTSNGKLGVNASGSSGVVVNVNNYTDGQVSVQESRTEDGEIKLDVLINRSVGKAIGEGRFDRQFSQSYGLTRRGN